jgi:hypothetical protein
LTAVQGRLPFEAETQKQSFDCIPIPAPSRGLVLTAAMLDPILHHSIIAVTGEGAVAIPESNLLIAAVSLDPPTFSLGKLLATEMMFLRFSALALEQQPATGCRSS